MNNQPTMPVPGSNQLAPLHEFVITVIQYQRVKDWLTGEVRIVPVRTIIRG